MGLEDFLILGALAAGGYAVYQRSQNSQGYGSSSPGVIKTVKKTTTTQQVTVPTLLQTPVSLGEPLSDYYAADVRSPSDYLDTTFDPSLYGPIVTSVQGAVLSPAPAKGSTVGYLDPNEAYSLVQKGKYTSDVKNKLISKYFYWRDVFSPRISPAESRVKTIPKQSYHNAYQLALVLDQLVVEYGKKFTINCWIRLSSSSFHSPSKAMAVDIGEPFSACKKGGALFNAARRIAAIRGVGYPTSASQNALHIDIGNHSSGQPSGMQFVFIDNGDRNYTGSLQAVQH